MILLFKKKDREINKQYQINAEVPLFEGIVQDETDQTPFSAPAQSTEAFTTLKSYFLNTEELQTTCTYPVNIKELYPYWLRIQENGNSLLISLTQKYYDWLTCHTNDINDISFLRLEDLIDLENIPNSTLEHLANTYLNSLPKESITQNIVNPEELKKLIDNIKINLYAKKGTEDSFKLVINELFNIDPDTIYISYPKRFVLRLNGGRYDWMRDPTNDPSNPVSGIDLYPSLTNSYLNYSILTDGDLWQEHSYVINVAGLSLTQYQNVVRPILHPAGTLDFFQKRQDIFNRVFEEITVTETETPYFKNYALYKIGSTGSILYTLGCTLAGITSPMYRFPSWDKEISEKYYPGMSFGEINISDFFTLSPADGTTFVNAGLTCS